MTAANSQQPLLMRVEFRVGHTDHEWVVAGRYKLIQSVYAGIHIMLVCVGNKEAVGYSGPTYIEVR